MSQILLCCVPSLSLPKFISVRYRIKARLEFLYISSIKMREDYQDIVGLSP